VAIPAATARNVTNNLAQYSYAGLILGSLATVLGVVGFKYTGLAAGPLIAIVSTLFFLLSLGLKR
jgi:ABC-type Mn2+/Zn2+ transport system permease subunit